MISRSKLTGLRRFYGELEEKKDPKAIETDDNDYCSESDIESPLEFNEDHTHDSPLCEDVLPRDPSRKPSGPMVRVFEYDDDEPDGANKEDICL